MCGAAAVQSSWSAASRPGSLPSYPLSRSLVAARWFRDHTIISGLWNANSILDALFLSGSVDCCPLPHTTVSLFLCSWNRRLWLVWTLFGASIKCLGFPSTACCPHVLLHAWGSLNSGTTPNRQAHTFPKENPDRVFPPNWFKYFTSSELWATSLFYF